ncbi:MAG: acyltransferase [Treponema sp.]|nr:acyltransferase [Treponema sp.]
MPLQKRNSNFELLRILTMFCVVANHSCAFQFSTPGFLGQFYSMYYAFGLAGLNSFFMMSGYFMGNRPSISKMKIISIFVQVLYCQLLSLLVFIIFKLTGLYSHEGTTTLQLFGIAVRFYVVPLTSDIYWYITAYVILLALIPVINPFIQKLNAKGFIILILIAGILWYGFSFVFHYRYAHIQRAVFFYLLGAYIRLHADTKSLRRFIIAIVMFAVCYAISVQAFYLFQNEDARRELCLKLVHKDISQSYYVDMLLHFLSYVVFSPLCSILIFEIFRNFTFSSSIINTISATTFSIYLLHCQPLFNSSFHSLKLPNAKIEDGTAKCLALSLAFWLLTFAVCSAVDLIRLKVLKNQINAFTENTVSWIKRKFYLSQNEA